MIKTRLYCGLSKDGQWYNYTEVKPMKGGVLAMLDTEGRTGAARLLNVLKGSIDTLLDENGKEYKMKEQDYREIKIVDSWKIAYEQIKIVQKNDYPIIPENFHCHRCSLPNNDRFTPVNESWQKLIEDGIIDEFFLNNPDTTFTVELPDPIVIEAGRTIQGGSYSTIVRDRQNIDTMDRVQKNPRAMRNSAKLIYAMWDASIVKIHNMNDREFNILVKRDADEFFSEKYMSTQPNIEAMNDAEEENIIGLDAKARKVICKYCGEEIGGYLDFTNFFSPLLPKKSSQNQSTNVAMV